MALLHRRIARASYKKPRLPRASLISHKSPLQTASVGRSECFQKRSA
jgi:hypothetical protein